MSFKQWSSKHPTAASDKAADTPKVVAAPAKSEATAENATAKPAPTSES